MNAKFTSLLKSVEPKYRKLVKMAPVKYTALPQGLPKRGVYLFSEGSKHLYVGRTKGLRERLRGHCVPSGSQFTATFAFRLAREKTGRKAASYTKVGSRVELLKDAAFASAFDAAKQRIALMDIRFVEEKDPTRQALLEIYTSTVLKTPYNDFDTH